MYPLNLNTRMYPLNPTTSERIHLAPPPANVSAQPQPTTTTTMATTATTTITTTKTNPRGDPTSFSALPKENVYVGLLHVCERTAEATPELEPLESDVIPL